MSPTPLTALSPLDGRYHGKVDALRDIFSEFGLIQRRVQVELAWLKALSECADIAEVPVFSSASTDRLDQILADFDEIAGRGRENDRGDDQSRCQSRRILPQGRALKDNSGAQRGQRIRAFWLHQRGY